METRIGTTWELRTNLGKWEHQLEHGRHGSWRNEGQLRGPNQAHFFMIKVAGRQGLEAALLDIMKVIYSELRQHVPNGEKVKAFPTKIGNRTRVNTLSTPVHHSDRSLSKSSNTGEADRSDSNRGEVKCPCLQMTHAVVRSWWLYQQISAKQEGTINTQTSTTFLYTNVKHNEKETREKCHSQWPQKNK